LSVRLYYHPESDSLFWDDNWPQDGLCEDVTDEKRFQDAAAVRGIKCPGKITQIIDAKVEPSGGLAGAIQASYRAWERKPSDFYPTPFDVTQSLMPLVKVIVRDGGSIWEPCCGNMDMSRVLEWHGYEVTSTDLRETGQGIGGFDFINDDPEEKWGWIPEPEMIVMNPPFSLAAEFIERALEFTPNVACLVKIDYWNAVSRLPLFERKRPTFFLPLTWRPAFLKKERGSNPLMNCAWVVWTEENDFGDVCIFEPMRKLVYPGYQHDGVRTALAKFMQEVEALTEVISNDRSDA
jgi:hypothetical protein